MYCPVRTLVSEYTTIRRERRLPVRGEVMAEVGSLVEPNDVIARCSHSGEICLIDVARALSVPDTEVEQHLLKAVGDWVQSGEVVAARKGPVSLLNKTCRSPKEGIVTAISRGRLLLRASPVVPSEGAPSVELRAMLRGEVVEVIDGIGAIIEGHGGLVEGVWGWGDTSAGVLKLLVSAPDEPLTTASIDVASEGHILVGGACIDQAALLRAAEVKVNGIVVGSIHGTLVELGTKLPFPLVITEGFGHVPMADIIFDLLGSYEGDIACLSGPAESPRGHERPEIIMFPAARRQDAPPEDATSLQEGTSVRITREPHMGRTGTVRSILPKARVVESGVSLPSAEIRLSEEDGVTVPIANLELI